MTALTERSMPAADHGNRLADANEAYHRGEFDDVAEMRIGAKTSDKRRSRNPEDCHDCIGDQRAA